jgi:hypothetical protein
VTNRAVCSFFAWLEQHGIGGLVDDAAGDLLTTYIYVSVDLSYPVTKALQNFTKKGLVRGFRTDLTLLLN